MLGSGEERDKRRSWLGRSALLPLVVIVLLVYLASQTLFDGRGADEDLAYVDAKALVRDSPERVELVRFRPRSNGLELRLADGRTVESHYPTDESAFALEELMDQQGVRYDSAGGRGSAWWSFLTYLLPFVLFFGFWIFLMRNVERFGRDRPSADA